MKLFFPLTSLPTVHLPFSVSEAEGSPGRQVVTTCHYQLRKIIKWRKHHAHLRARGLLGRQYLFCNFRQTFELLFTPKNMCLRPKHQKLKSMWYLMHFCFNQTILQLVYKWGNKKLISKTTKNNFHNWKHKFSTGGRLQWVLHTLL